MEKIIIKCPKCKKKMRVRNKVAKYKCPNCSHIYKLNRFKLILLNIKGFFVGFVDTVVSIKSSIIYKFKSMISTYKYMSKVRKNMRSNPNWSNYHREQREMKNANKRSFKDIFKRKK